MGSFTIDPPKATPLESHLERATSMAFAQILAAEKLIRDDWKIVRSTNPMTIAVAQIIATNLASLNEPKGDVETKATVAPRRKPR